MTPSPRRVTLPPRALPRRLACVALALPFASPLAAQTPPDTAPFTLHVYTDLVQVPTLVLGTELQMLPPIAPEKFSISLDAGPSFHPIHVRREGDDPIQLAVLLDLSGSQTDLVPSLRKALPGWVAGSLTARDHVSLYALDCATVRTADDLPPDPTLLAAAFENALHAPALHGAKSHPACGSKLRLWDTLAVIANHLAEQPGRRAILAITGGVDGASTTTWNDLHFFAADRSVAIFGLSLVDTPVLFTGRSAPAPGRRGNSSSTTTMPFPAREDPFEDVCELTGGLVLRINQPSTAARDLPLFVAMLRGRYILEFPRPSNSTSGRHGIEISLNRTLAYIRPAGITVPLADPNIAADPTTVPPADPGRAPQLGKRHPID